MSTNHRRACDVPVRMMRLRPAFFTALFALLVGAATACGGSSDVRLAPVSDSAEQPATIAAAWDESRGVRIGTSPDFPPSSFINERGEIDGFDREVADEICRRTELRCDWVQNDWATIIPSLLSGDYDVIVSGMAATKEREELIDFTQGYQPNTPSAYVARAGAGEAAVNGKIAVQVNTIQHDYLVELGAARISSLSAGDAVEAVIRGDADAVLADRTFLQPFVEASNGDLEFVGPEVPFEFNYVSIGVRKNDGELKNRLNAAIDRMKDDGTLNDLIIKWFGEGAAIFE